MKLKIWQKLELGGAVLVLLSLFFQLFGAWNIDENARQTDDLVTKERLNHVYAYLKTGKEIEPPWEKIEEHYAGPKKLGDAHFRFEEVSALIKVVCAALFVVGAVLSVGGKMLEYRAGNDKS